MKTNAKQLFLPFIPRGRREQRRIRKINRRAWRCTHKHNSGFAFIMYASDAGEAKQEVMKHMRESQVECKFIDLRASRAPEYDGKEGKKTTKRKNAKSNT